MLPLIVLTLATCNIDWIHADPSIRHFVDSNGSVRIFHGLNIAYKIPPYFPDTDYYSNNDSLTYEDVLRIKRWGFNLVRLGVFWAGVNPSEGYSTNFYLNNEQNLYSNHPDNQQSKE